MANLQQEHDASNRDGVCFCPTCRDSKIQTYRNLPSVVLKHMLLWVFPSQNKVALEKLYRQNLESVVVSKAYKTAILQDSKYRYLKPYLKNG